MGKKTTRVRRNFTSEFKRDAVRLLRGGRSVTDVAQSLGIARSLLQRWPEQIDASAEEAFPGRGNQTGDQEELRKMKQKLRDVTEERNILEKALAYFADDQK
jgi:transposase